MDIQQRDYDPEESTNMAKRRNTRVKYDDDFKREAVRLMDARGSRTVDDIAESLGVSSSMLHRWKQRFGQSTEAVAAPALSSELKALRKRVRELEMEREILEKATAFFAKKSR